MRRYEQEPLDGHSTRDILDVPAWRDAIDSGRARVTPALREGSATKHVANVVTAVIIGIDPGVGGAVAILRPDGELVVHDTPTATVKGSRREYLVADMAALLRVGPAVAVLEQGIPMPNQSSRTTYLTGRGGGLWEGMLAALGIRYITVAPNVWKRAMGLPAGADKGASRVLAQRLFPGHAGLFSRVRDDGRAEAALMAEYGRRKGV